jgi:hypothetical protein
MLGGSREVGVTITDLIEELEFLRKTCGNLTVKYAITKEDPAGFDRKIGREITLGVEKIDSYTPMLSIRSIQ